MVIIVSQNYAEYQSGGWHPPISNAVEFRDAIIIIRLDIDW